MKKKVLSAVLAIALVLGSAALLPQGKARSGMQITAIAEAGEFGTYGDYDYMELSDGNVMIMSYNGNDTDLSIPSSFEDKTVTAIGYEAFARCNELLSVKIPSSVKSIGNSAFDGCEKLSAVIISDGVTDIGEGAFARCNLLASISIPKSVKAIDSYAFLDTKWLKKSNLLIR